MGAKPSTPTTENNEEELVALCSISSDGSLRQQRVLGHLTSREDETLQEDVQPTTENNEDVLVPLFSVPSDGSLGQQRVLGHLTSRDDETFQEVDVGHSVESMFEAVTRGDFKTLSTLLTNYPTICDAVDSEENTALHCAVMSASHKGDTHDSYYHCIDVLMNCLQMNINMPNKHGYTALDYALNDLHVTCVEYMLKHPSSNRLYLDYYPGDRESTVREIIMQTYPELQPLFPAPIMESLVSSETDIKLLTALQRGDYETFRQTLDSTNSNTWYDEPYHSSLLEIACQMKNRKEFVESLLEKDADPNIKNRVTGFPLLHATARSGNFGVLEILLKKDETDARVQDSENRTVLHWWARVSERKPGDKQMLENCFKLLMEKYSVTKMGIDLRDKSDNTALYMAVESGFRDRAKLLLSEGADFMVFEHGSKVLLSASLSIVEEFLDNCLESNDKPATNKDLELRLNYRRLLKIVPHMVESHHHRDLLKHPVMSTFLILKWQEVKYTFILDRFFYVMFVLFLTVYILCSESYNTLNEGGVANNTTCLFSFNDSYITSDMNDNNLTSQPNDNSLYFLWLSLMFLLFVLIQKEMHQLIIHRRAYIVSPEHWLEVSLFISTFISCNDVASMLVKLHFSAIALLLAWLELLVMLGGLPQLSVQKEMLKYVSLTFLRLMAGYVLLLIAFALSFYILFKGSFQMDGTDMFASPYLSVLKTIVMFTGEFDVSNLPFDNFPVTSHVIFLLFVFLVAIILFNVLSVAVSEAGEIKKEAETLSLTVRAKLISRIEEVLSALPKCLKPSVQLTGVIYSKERNMIDSTTVRSLLSIISKETKLNKETQTSGNQEKWDMFTEKLSALELRQEKLEKILYSKSDETQQILMQILTRLDNRECETTPL